MTRLVFLLVCVAAAIAWYVALPRPAVVLPPAGSVAAPVRGAIHVHTRRSDGTGTVETVAAAAAAAGLRFIIVTDHGDGTRMPDPPRYQSGVLCIDAVEISTDDGHLVAIGLAKAPYKLGGEARDVVEDVQRLGGMAIAAHPTSMKPELAWRDWDVPLDGLEWLNGDSEWRDESVPTLLRVLLAYPGRRSESLALLLDRPGETLRRWDSLGTRRKVVGIAAADAHARLGLRGLGEPYDNGASFRMPGYETVFRAFSIGLQGVALSGDAAADADAILQALREGRVYSTIDAVAGPAAFTLRAVAGEQSIDMGGSVVAGVPVMFGVEAQAPPDARVVLLRDGAEISSADGAVLNEHLSSPDPGVYRAEVRVPGAPGEPPVPWLVSNPIYVGLNHSVDVPSRPQATETSVRYDDGPATAWAVEASPRSLGAVDTLQEVGGQEVGFRWALGGAMSESPFAALVMPAGEDLAAYDRLTFTARATRPTRVSVQLRAAGDGADERWHRSVYLDETPREITIFFVDMRPRGVTAQPRPDLARVQSVLFVVDTVNADTGTNGQFIVDDVRYAR